MKTIYVSLVAAALAIAAGYRFSESAVGAVSERLAVVGGKLPTGYRDWRLISVAHEEGDLKDLRAILGNDVAIKTYRAGKTPLPDGAIVARLAWKHVPSDDNNRAFGRAQSFVAGAPTTIQIMVKDAHKFASTGGWGFAQFTNEKPDVIAPQACFACHTAAKGRDFVFATYSP